jgi:hypothetical protein
MQDSDGIRKFMIPEKELEGSPTRLDQSGEQPGEEPRTLEQACFGGLTGGGQVKDPALLR